jgi:hypothetical protein
MAGHVAQVGANVNAFRILVGKPERKRALGRPRQVNLRKDGVVCTGLIWFRIGTSGWLLRTR